MKSLSIQPWLLQSFLIILTVSCQYIGKNIKKEKSTSGPTSTCNIIWNDQKQFEYIILCILQRFQRICMLLSAALIPYPGFRTSAQVYRIYRSLLFCCLSEHSLSKIQDLRPDILDFWTIAFSCFK